MTAGTGRWCTGRREKGNPDVPKYTETERTAFLELACTVGPHKARADLGYPSPITSTRWMKQAGVDWSDAIDQVRGRALRQAYDDAELVNVGTLLLDSVVDILENGQTHVLDSGAVIRVPAGPASLWQLSGTFGKVVEQLRLIQGRSTENVAVHVADDTTRRHLAESIEANAGVLRQLEAG